eukprot:7826489-Pyramimonas_sp.AAC.1
MFPKGGSLHEGVEHGRGSGAASNVVQTAWRPHNEAGPISIKGTTFVERIHGQSGAMRGHATQCQPMCMPSQHTSCHRLADHGLAAT